MDSQVILFASIISSQLELFAEELSSPGLEVKIALAEAKAEPQKNVTPLGKQPTSEVWGHASITNVVVEEGLGATSCRETFFMRNARESSLFGHLRRTRVLWYLGWGNVMYSVVCII